VGNLLEFGRISMLHIRRSKPVVLGLALVLMLMTISLAAIPAFAVQVYSGEITKISGNTIVLNGYREFVPANEHARVPDWAKEGTKVKVGYYIQNEINYYQEIGRSGKLLKIEKNQAWDVGKGDF
jgi:hypothetical protein